MFDYRDTIKLAFITMVLSDTDIKSQVGDGTIAIEPFLTSNLKQGSYTFTLSALIFKPKPQEIIDLSDPQVEHEAIKMKEDGYILDPGEFVVGFTAEKLTLPQGIYCILGTRGSRAQLGLDVLQSSTLVEPGSDNQLALEICNHSQSRIRLRAGDRIVKGIFLQLTSASESTNMDGEIMTRYIPQNI